MNVKNIKFHTEPDAEAVPSTSAPLSSMQEPITAYQMMNPAMALLGPHFSHSQYWIENNLTLFADNEQ